MNVIERRTKAKSILITGWEELVESGEFSLEDMLESLTEQVEENCQGWDCSTEELDNSPELFDIMGYDEDMTDEQIDEWLEIVQEAAREFILKWEG